VKARSSGQYVPLPCSGQGANRFIGGNEECAAIYNHCPCINNGAAVAYAPTLTLAARSCSI